MTELGKILSRLLNLQSGGFTGCVKLTGNQVAVTAATYSSGYVLGTSSPIAIELTRSQTGTGILNSLVVQDLSNQSGAIDIVVFDSNPTATTFTNNAALDVADADLSKIIGAISVTSSDYITFADNCIATKTSIGLAIRSSTDPFTKIWIVPVSRDTKTYVANELSFVLGILQD